MATPLSYRQWLQLKANDTSGQVPTDVTYGKLLLGIAGDDGKLDANAVGGNKTFKGDDGIVYSTAGDKGNFAQAGKGLMDVNSTMFARYNAYANNPTLVGQINQENQGYTTGSSGGSADTSAAERATLKGRIGSRAGEIDTAYGSLFDDLDNLLKSRDNTLETEYGGQLKKASDQYADALPAIDQSYAALGSYDSTQRGDSRGKAKTGFDETTQTIGANKQKDKAALGQFGNESKAKFSADRDAAHRAVSSADQTTDVDALRRFSDDLDTNLSTTGVTKATLGTDGQAAQSLSSLTADNGRYDAAVNALDSILKSSMADDTKAAAVQAVTTSAGLSDDEKKKVQAQFGNVYAEQAAL